MQCKKCNSDMEVTEHDMSNPEFDIIMTYECEMCGFKAQAFWNLDPEQCENLMWEDHFD